MVFDDHGELLQLQTLVASLFAHSLVICGRVDML